MKISKKALIFLQLYDKIELGNYALHKKEQDNEKI
jgi:hypothetical protein